MKIGIIGLGKMGQSIAYRLHKAGHQVVAYDKNAHAVDEARSLGIEVTEQVVTVGRQARTVWLMVPAGKVVDDVLHELVPALQRNDIVVDGGNSNFHDSIRRSRELEQRGVYFLDCGTSGGIRGQEHGFSLMIGGQKTAYERMEQYFKIIAAPHGYGYMGPSGSGHYVKMIHNGIEYALLQAYAEGFHVLKDGTFKDLDLEEISRVWLHGSIIRSFILELTHEIFKKDQSLADISGSVAHTGMGQWTVQEAHAQQVRVSLIELALKIREESLHTGGNYATRLVALLRHKFGGHAVKKKN